MKWYNDKRCMGIVLSTRVRLARNIKGYSFIGKMTPEQRASMIKEVKNVCEKYGTERYNYIDMRIKSIAEKNYLVEEHIISSEFASITSSDNSMLIRDENNSISMMVGEEDHIRIQSIRPGMAIEEAYKAADLTDNMLSAGLEFAFDDKLGYLTRCPSNTGTGMRISCMLHLPMLTRNDLIKQVVEYCTRNGLTVRGFFGEGSNADGEIYQISNQITLGISETETIKIMTEAVSLIAEKERNLRNKLKCQPPAVIEKLWRSYGILTQARCMNSGEFLKLWSDCMLGSDSGIIDEIVNVNMVRMLIECMPYHIMNGPSNCTDPILRDSARADIIRNMLKTKG